MTKQQYFVILTLEYLKEHTERDFMVFRKQPWKFRESKK